MVDASLSQQSTETATLTEAAKKPRNIKYFFLQLDVAATNGISSIFKKGNPAPDIGLSGGVTPLFRSTYWTYTVADDARRVGTISTRWARWVNLRGSANIATYNIFSQVDTPNMAKEKTTDYPYSAYVSYNSFYNSDFDGWNKFKSSIFSIGLGLAKTNNFASLEKRTFEEGTITMGPTGTTYKAVTDETNGAIGPLVKYQGLAAYAEYYKPVTKLYPDGSQKINLYLGVRATYYGLFKASHILNGSGGVFLNIKKGDADAHKRREDALNLALTANFQDVEQLGGQNYWANKFGVSVSASVPIKLDK